jgi:hypothetical protein
MVFSVIIGATLGLMAFIGFLVYLLFVIIVLMSDDLRSNGYYALAVSLGFADMGFLLITFTYAAPAMIMQQSVGIVLIENKRTLTSLKVVKYCKQLLVALYNYYGFRYSQVCRRWQ